MAVDDDECTELLEALWLLLVAIAFGGGEDAESRRVSGSASVGAGADDCAEGESSPSLSVLDMSRVNVPASRCCSMWDAGSALEGTVTPNAQMRVCGPGVLLLTSRSGTTAFSPLSGWSGMSKARMGESTADCAVTGVKHAYGDL